MPARFSAFWCSAIRIYDVSFSGGPFRPFGSASLTALAKLTILRPLAVTNWQIEFAW